MLPDSTTNTIEPPQVAPPCCIEPATPTLTGNHAPSGAVRSNARSLRLARRIARAMKGATIHEKPVGSPRFRSVIRVLSSVVADQVYVVSMGNGPYAVRITSVSFGSRSANHDLGRDVDDLSHPQTLLIVVPVVCDP